MYQVRKIGETEVRCSFDQLPEAIEYLNSKYQEQEQFEIRNPSTGEVITWGKVNEQIDYTLIECLERLYYTSRVNSNLSRKDAYMRLKTHIEMENANDK